MFGLGVWEFALILVVALLVLGPERLPKVARTLGRGMRELRKAMSDFQTNLASVDVDEPHERAKNRFPPPPPKSTESTGATFVPTESNLYGDEENTAKQPDGEGDARPAPAPDEESEPK